MLYFMSDGRRLKIGQSTRVDLRRRQVQTGNSDPVRVVFCVELSNAVEVEGQLHARLSHCRKQGEWFEVSLATAFQHLVAIKDALRFADDAELLLAGTTAPDGKRKPSTPEEFEAFWRWVTQSYPDAHPRVPFADVWRYVGDAWLSEGQL